MSAIRPSFKPDVTPGVFRGDGGGATDQFGFTLVEMLVVLAIIAVMAGAVALSLGRSGSGGRALETEAQRLATRLRLASDDVRLDERPLALVWDERGYAFLDWDANTRKWRPDRLAALARHDLPAGTTLVLPGAKPPLPIGGEGAGPPIAARLSNGGRSWEVRFDGLDARAARAGG